MYSEGSEQTMAILHLPRAGSCYCLSLPAEDMCNLPLLRPAVTAGHQLHTHHHPKPAKMLQGSPLEEHEAWMLALLALQKASEAPVA